MSDDSCGKEESEREGEVMEDDNLESEDEVEAMEEGNEEYDPSYEMDNVDVEDDEEELIGEDSGCVLIIGSNLDGKFLVSTTGCQNFGKISNNITVVHNFVLLFQPGYCKSMGICGQNPNTLSSSPNCCYFTTFSIPARLKIHWSNQKLLDLMPL